MKRVYLAVVVLVATGCGAAEMPGALETTAGPTPPSVNAPVRSTASRFGPTTVTQPSVAKVAADDSECSDSRITFEHPPVDLDKIEYITPFGLMSGSHVTPVDHQYYQNFKEPDVEIAVYSPAAGTITDIQRMSETVADGAAETIDDYRLVIEHTCTISSIFIHVGRLSPRIAELAPPPGGSDRIDLEVAAGEEIGSYFKNVDYNVVDLDVTLDGLLSPALYEREPWKVHTPDPFDYFTPEIREDLIAKSLRVAEPVAGKFDYDIEGRLVGNWFQQGTHGYGGADQERYWSGHLAIAYNLFDPSHVMVSIGTFDGVSVQYGVRGNTPDPADVSMDSGVVKYELVDYDFYVDGDRWDRMSLVKGISVTNYDTATHGVVLFELLDDRTLQVETFPGRTAEQVGGFTDQALLYER